jgi:hypothetical protein
MNPWISTLGTVLAAAISGYAAIMASKAEKNSRPVGNGFTGHVLSELSHIRRMMIDHLINHDPVARPAKLPDSEPDCG